MHQYIQDFHKYEDGQEVTIKGWVVKIRNSKTNHFFDFRDGTGFTQCIVSMDAVGEEAFEEAKRFTLETAVAFTGALVKNEKSLGGYEIQVTSFEVYQIGEGFPITQADNEHGPKFLEDHRHLWLRRRRQWAIMRVRNELQMGIHDFFQKEGFVQMDAPLLTGNACEGTTDLFETEFFGDPAYLSQSGQLYGEAMAMAMNKIYTFGPTFRSEKSNTPRHLAEFWMIEPEMAFFTNEDNMETIQQFVKHVIARALKNCATELDVLERDTASLQLVVDQEFPKVLYTEAVKILRGEKLVNGKNAIEVQEADLAAAKARIEEAQAEIDEMQAAIKKGIKKGVRRGYERKIPVLQAEIKDCEEQVRNIPQWIDSAKNFKDGEDLGGSDETVLTRVFDAPVMVYNWPTKIKAFYM
ncbi:MAG: asparagine--tRNA ligase, partial [Aureispira sp.]|nr:asparagine--tRNA ligase [Aureispira sp.]